MSYSEYDHTKPMCSKCNSKKNNRLYGYDLQNMTGSIIKSDCDLKLGDLANRNRDKMSADHKMYLYNKHNSYKYNHQELPQGMSRIKKGPKTEWT
jgi:hypothetical protein